MVYKIQLFLYNAAHFSNLKIIFNPSNLFVSQLVQHALIFNIAEL